jgi:hypothetical protein
VREIRMLGSVEGARGNRRPYSNITIPDLSDHDAPRSPEYAASFSISSSGSSTRCVDLSARGGTSA